MARREQLLKYENFNMTDMDGEHGIELVRLTYLAEMFDIAVENKKDKPIKITLTEKPDHFAKPPAKSRR